MFSLGFYPIDGYICPKGVHNMIPEFLRPYIPTFKNTYSPLYSFYDFSRPDLIPLGIKLFPDRYLISQKRKVYNAIVKFDMKQLESLLEDEKENSKIFHEIILDYFQTTAMGLACSIGNIEAVHFLLLKGVNINQKSGKNEKTPLHLAVENNQDLLVKFLLHNGADLYAKDKFGFDVYEKSENRGIYGIKATLDYFKNKKYKNVKKLKNNEDEDLLDTYRKNENKEIENSNKKCLFEIRKEKQLYFEQIKTHKEIILEHILTPNLEKFRPSDILEINMSNIASKNFAIYEADDNINDVDDKINIDNFNFYIVNIPGYDRIYKDIVDENGFKINNKIVRYDDLVFAKI